MAASRQKKQERNALDSALIKQVGGRPKITTQDLEKIWEEIKGLITLRRLAHFLNQKKKKLCETCRNWLEKRVRFNLNTLPFAPING